MKILARVQEKYAVDEDRIYLVGHSVGGVGVFGALITYPDTFAAAVSSAGGWPEQDAWDVPRIPLRLYHSTDDPQVPVRYSRNLAHAINLMGGEAEYIEYRDAGHGSNLRAFTNDGLWSWLFAQRRS
jgi:predicted peptidase